MGKRVKGAFRPDIQALRTVAVLLVVLFHLWPGRVSGGFVGVDVFFVVSGFLINSHILRDVEKGEFSVPRFWARRVRRLLPASLTVLAFTAIGVILFVPTSLWAQWLTEVISSIFYFENWVLAANAVDYLALENVASPTQHFWSLGVEEQFYIVWPLLIALALLFVPKVNKRLRRLSILTVLSLVTIASLVFGIYSTATDPAIAYFSTPVRAWEFGFGALLAFVPPLVSRIWQPVLSVLGLVTIITTGLLYDSSIPFPGTAAILPVAATSLVIYANLNSGPVAKLISFRPIQWIGDHSYAIYLWHWPLIILTPFVLQVDKLSSLMKLAIILLTFALAAVSAAFIERPLMSTGIKPNLRPRTIFAIVLVISTTFGGSIWLTVDANNRALLQRIEEVNRLSEQLPKCLGAQVMAVGESNCVNNELKGFYPSLEAASSDNGFDRKVCSSVSRSDWKPKDCQIGERGADIRIALVGDSHAGHYRGAFKRLAKLNHWSVNVFGKGACPFSDAVRVHDAELTASCKKWVVEVKRQLLNGNYDLVVTSQAAGVEWTTSPGMSQEESAESGLVTLWSDVIAKGIPVVVLKDNPRPIAKVLRCLELKTLDECMNKRSKAFLYDPQVGAVAKINNPLVTLVNLDDFFCAETQCSPVIGHVIVYRDAGHLTNTYVSTLSPFIEPKIIAALGDKAKQ